MIHYVTEDRLLGVSIEPDAIEAMVAASCGAWPDETGGILIGRYTRWKDRAILERATRAPRDSSASRFGFQRGIYGLTRLLTRAWRRELHYVGEWHFHPMGAAMPSKDDIAQMHELGSDPTYKCRLPILVVLGGEPADLRTGVFIIDTATVMTFARLDELRSREW